MYVQRLVSLPNTVSFNMEFATMQLWFRDKQSIHNVAAISAIPLKANVQDFALYNLIVFQQYYSA